MTIKHMNRADLIATLKADGVYNERPDLALHIINGMSSYTSRGVTHALAGSHAARSHTRAEPVTEPVLTRSVANQPLADQDADRAIADYEARRRGITSAVPAAPDEANRESQSSLDKASDDFIAAARGYDNDRHEQEVDARVRHLFAQYESPAPTQTRSAATDLDKASDDFLSEVMRGVNDLSANSARASADPSGDFLKLALQDISNFDGPEAA